MKKVLLTIISVCLIAASIFGLFAGVSSFSDIMNVKEYKEKDAEEGLEAIETLNDGLDQLQEAEGTYLAGVDTYTAGLIAYSEGKTQLSAGYAAYYAGKKQLEEGKAAYAAGKKQIEDNTAAYNEGKATLAKIEPLMPYVNQYVEFRDGTIANLAGFSNAQAWFVSVVRPIAAKQGLDIPADVTDLPAYIQQMVADGKAQLKQYEDGLAQLAEADELLTAVGFVQYLPRRWAKPGCEDKFWQGAAAGMDVLAFGLCACTKLDGMETTNTGDLSVYLAHSADYEQITVSTVPAKKTNNSSKAQLFPVNGKGCAFYSDGWKVLPLSCDYEDFCQILFTHPEKGGMIN